MTTITLRTRLLLGYGYLVLLLLLTATAAGLAMQQLSRKAEQTLHESLQTVRSGIALIEALERQDSATLELLLGDPQAQDHLAVATRVFADALDEAGRALRERAEESIVAGIAARQAEYVAARAAMPAGLAGTEAYRSSVFPAFAAVKAQVLALLEADRRAVVAADSATQRFARRASGALALLAGLALLSLGYISRRLQADLLARLVEMKQAVQAIAAGDRKRRVRVRGSDELALVGRQLNAALDAQVDQQSRAEGRQNQQRQLLLALLDRWPEPAAVVGLDGVLIASTLDDIRTSLVVVGEEAIQKRGREKLSRMRDPRDLDFEMAIGEASLRVAALVAGGTRPVGWLLRVDFAEEEQ